MQFIWSAVKLLYNTWSGSPSLPQQGIEPLTFCSATDKQEQNHHPSLPPNKLILIQWIYRSYPLFHSQRRRKSLSCLCLHPLKGRIAALHQGGFLWSRTIFGFRPSHTGLRQKSRLQLSPLLIGQVPVSEYTPCVALIGCLRCLLVCGLVDIQPSRTSVFLPGCSTDLTTLLVGIW